MMKRPRCHDQTKLGNAAVISVDGAESKSERSERSRSCRMRPGSLAQLGGSSRGPMTLFVSIYTQ